VCCIRLYQCTICAKVSITAPLISSEGDQVKKLPRIMRMMLEKQIVHRNEKRQLTNCDRYSKNIHQNLYSGAAMSGIDVQMFHYEGKKRPKCDTYEHDQNKA
jgi:hypothetical protein